MNSQQGEKDAFRKSWNRNLTLLWKIADITINAMTELMFMESIKGKIYIKENQITNQKVKLGKGLQNFKGRGQRYNEDERSY